MTVIKPLIFLGTMESRLDLYDYLYSNGAMKIVNDYDEGISTVTYMTG